MAQKMRYGCTQVMKQEIIRHITRRAPPFSLPGRRKVTKSRKAHHHTPQYAKKCFMGLPYREQVVLGNALKAFMSLFAASVMFRTAVSQTPEGIICRHFGLLEMATCLGILSDDGGLKRYSGGGP